MIEYDENEKLIRTLGLQTDISHLKKDNRQVLSLIGLDDEPSYFDIDVKQKFKTSPEILTQKEKQVLRLMISGNLSKEISEVMHISKTTVDTHRKNMLSKTNSKSPSELVSKAILNGWI